MRGESEGRERKTGGVTWECRMVSLSTSFLPASLARVRTVAREISWSGPPPVTVPERGEGGEERGGERGWRGEGGERREREGGGRGGERERKGEKRTRGEREERREEGVGKH